MSARAGTQSASRDRARSHAHLEDAEHLPAHAHGHRERDARRRAGGGPVPRRGPVLERAAREGVVGRRGREGRRRAGGGPGQGRRGRVAVRHPEPRLRAVEAVHERVEHGGRGLRERQGGREGLGRALAGGGQALAAPPVAEVADVRGEDDPALDVGGDDDDLDRHERAVGAHGGRLAAAAEVGALAGQDEVAQAAPAARRAGRGERWCRRPRGRGSRSGCSRRAAAPPR